MDAWLVCQARRSTSGSRGQQGRAPRNSSLWPVCAALARERRQLGWLQSPNESGVAVVPSPLTADGFERLLERSAAFHEHLGSVAVRFGPPAQGTRTEATA